MSATSEIGAFKHWTQRHEVRQTSGLVVIMTDSVDACALHEFATNAVSISSNASALYVTKVTSWLELSDD